MARSRPHGGGDGDSSSGRRSRSHGGGDETVAAAQESVATAARSGRSGGGDGRGGSESTAEEAPALAGAGPEVGSARSFVDAITGDPRSVAGRSAQDIADQFQCRGISGHGRAEHEEGYVRQRRSGAHQHHPEITNIQVHPAWGADDLGGNVIRYDE
jgi:hypothetical protein